MKLFKLCFVAAFLTACNGQVATQKIASNDNNTNIKACIACHGEDGMSGKPGVPPIGHMSADELIDRVTVQKETNLGFPLLTHTMTKEDVLGIAEYFAEVNKN